jgi:putative membrane protein
MAWMRTSVSLIGFGFTIVQFFERLKGVEGAAARSMPDQAPRDLGLALIATGVGALVISTLRYRKQLNDLWSPAFKDIAGVYESPLRTPVFVAAMVLILVGVAAFASVFIHIL